MIDHDAAKRRVFHLMGPTTSYLFRVTAMGHLEHVHWGPRVTTADADALSVKTPTNGYQVAYAGDPAYSLDLMPLEWSGLGKGDYRQPAAEIKMPGGSFVTDFRYVSHEIIDGVVGCADGLPGVHDSAPVGAPAGTVPTVRVRRTVGTVPSVRVRRTLGTVPTGSAQATTLRVTLADRDVELDLYYTSFSCCDVIVRRSVLRNRAPDPVVIRRLMSQQTDLPNRAYDLVTFDGTWAAEAHRHVRPLAPGTYVNDSLTGTSSNRHNPGVILTTRGAGEHVGECYAFNLVYPGNHFTAVELSHRDVVRVLSGINPTGFEWTLGPGEQFETPEAVLAYSRDGFDGLSGTMHRFVHDHVVPANWADADRPVLVNTWESAMFGVDEKTVLAQARAARKIGAELVVLDDGWFAGRKDDRTGLGDYAVDAKKFPHGLAWLSSQVHGKGLKFGLWVEPEMVNPDSDLFRTHPDWAIGVAATGIQVTSIEPRSVGTLDGLPPAQGSQASSSADNLGDHSTWSAACGAASPNRRPPSTAPDDRPVDSRIMSLVQAPVGGTPVRAGDTADACSDLVATQNGRRGRRLGARGRLEPTSTTAATSATGTTTATSTDAMPCLQRNQLMLDLSREDVRDYIVGQVSAAIDEYRLDYVKWDCNRNMTDAGGELPHRYVLGLCDVLRRIFGPRPGVLFESCASGGNRFDLGMLTFSPQIWASDCTDPVERLDIQDGLSYLYPPSTMGAHVTASPSAQTLRATPLSTRFNVAAFGVLGYEFDLRTLNHAERRDVRAQVAFYKRHRKALQQGRFHRLESARPDQVGWAVNGAGETIVGHFQTRTRALTPPGVWTVPGLDPNRRYRIVSRAQTLGLDDFGHLLAFVLPKWLKPEGGPVAVLGRWYRLTDLAESFTASGAALAAGYGPSVQFEGSDERSRTRMWGDHGSTMYVVTPG